MAPQITNISAAATNSSGSVTGIVRNSNKIRGQSTSTGATMYASAKAVSTQASPRIAAVITSTNRIRVQTATVSSFSTTTTIGGSGSTVDCEDDTSFLDINWSRATTSCGATSGGSVSLSSRLNDLADVELVGALGGSFLVYNSSSDYWTFTSEISGGTF